VWVKFQGRLGRDQVNSFTGLTHLDGSPRGRLSQAFLRGLLGCLGGIPPGLCVGEGTPAPFAPGRRFARRRSGSP
jgi:hypothetical protein